MIRNRNNRGFTLIELLAVLVIISLAIGGGTMLFTSMQHLWTQSGDKMISRSQLKFTVNNVYSAMSEAVAVRWTASNELRFKTLDDEFKMLLFEPGQNRLSIYTADDATDLSNGTYTSNMIALTEQISGFSVLDSTGIPLNYDQNYDNGQLLTLRLTLAEQTVDVTVKLFEL